MAQLRNDSMAQLCNLKMCKFENTVNVEGFDFLIFEFE